MAFKYFKNKLVRMERFPIFACREAGLGAKINPSKTSGNMMNEKVKEKVSEWLIDVSKYIATAVVVSSFFDTMANKALVFAVGILSSLAALMIGVYLNK